MPAPPLQQVHEPASASIPDWLSAVFDDGRPAGLTVERRVVMPTVCLDGDFEPSARRVLECLERRASTAEFVVAIDGPAITPPPWL